MSIILITGKWGDGCMGGPTSQGQHLHETMQKTFPKEVSTVTFNGGSIPALDSVLYQTSGYQGILYAPETENLVAVSRLNDIDRKVPIVSLHQESLGVYRAVNKSTELARGDLADVMASVYDYFQERGEAS